MVKGWMVEKLKSFTRLVLRMTGVEKLTAPGKRGLQVQRTVCAE